MVPQNNVQQDDMEKQRGVTISVEIIHMNYIPFLVTYSINLRFITTEIMTNMKFDILKDVIQRVNTIYCSQGFNTNTSHVDGHFGTLRSELDYMKIHKNFASTDEHVPYIGRLIRVLK